MSRILRHVTVVRDGMHNAFTSLAWFRGAYWIAYRKAEWHGRSMLGTTCLSASSDGHRFREVARVKGLGDARDPVLVTAGDRLALLFPQLPSDPDAPLEQLLATSEDGVHWSNPRTILGPDQHIFRIRRHDNRFYGTQISRRGSSRAMLVRSDDLEHWEQVSRIGVDANELNETDVIFRPDGQAWVIARSKRKPSDDAYFCRADPPYTNWTMVDLKRRVHAPLMLEHNGKVYLAGRCNPRQEGEKTWPFGNSMCIWEVADGQLEPVLRIPATGDCTYPGFIQDPEGKIFLSYYSQHAYHWGVLPPFAGIPDIPRPPEGGPMTPAIADIYFAELELP